MKLKTQFQCLFTGILLFPEKEAKSVCRFTKSYKLRIPLDVKASYHQDNYILSGILLRFKSLAELMFLVLFLKRTTRLPLVHRLVFFFSALQ
jgi:hypothetical protein